MLTISINNKPCKHFSMTPLKGCLSQLMTPSKPKALITNTNTAIDGDVVVAVGRKVQSRTITLFFKIDGDNLVDLQNKIDYLEQELLNGRNNSGVCEVFVAELGRTYYLVYQEMSDYANFGEVPKATLRIKFVEPNPHNH